MMGVVARIAILCGRIEDSMIVLDNGTISYVSQRHSYTIWLVSSTLWILAGYHSHTRDSNTLDFVEYIGATILALCVE